MNHPTPLYYVWNYTAADRSFWREHLEDWVPSRIFDAHTHVQPPECRLHPMTEEKRRQFWVNEVLEPISAADAARCQATVFPNRQFSCLAFGIPDLQYDLEASNSRLREQCANADGILYRSFGHSGRRSGSGRNWIILERWA